MIQIDSIYFEGGEPFLFYPTLLAGIQAAHRLGFRIGLVTNGYWATSVADALEALRPMAGMVQELSISCDLYHAGEAGSRQAQYCQAAAEQLGIALSTLAIGQPGAGGRAGTGQLPPGESAVMYRGRAAAKLAQRAALQAWDSFDRCEHEDLREPGRLHVDPFGNVHLCQGLLLGNLFDVPLRVLCADYVPAEHPIAGPLLRGGPAELVRTYALPHHGAYADACHLCDEARQLLRPRFGLQLGPDQMYGVWV